MSVTVEVQGAFGERVSPAELETDAAGRVVTRLQAGGIPGQTVVRATAERVFRGQRVRVETQCQEASIVGGTPSQAGFTLSCPDPVLPAFSRRFAADDWRLVPGACTECRASVASRLGGRINEGVAITFLAEAGSVDQMVAVGADGATSRFCVAQPTPRDVEAFPYEVEAGAAEPLNPRDGLVRLVAVTMGEEAFDDVDADGLWNPGIDLQHPEQQLSDAYIDVNDNGAFDELLDPWRDSDQDGEFTFPNLDWDAQIEIWTSTTVLWVGDLAGIDQPCSRVRYACAPEPAGACVEDALDGPPTIVGVDGAFEVTADLRDDNGNCLGGFGEGAASLQIGGSWVIRGQEANVPLRDHCFSGPEASPLGDRVTWTVISRLEAGAEAREARDELTIGVDYRRAGGEMGRARCVVDVETALPPVE